MIAPTSILIYLTIQEQYKIQIRIKEVDESACLNRLMALEGAIQDIRWHNLSEEDKKNLKDFYNLQKNL